MMIDEISLLLSKESSPGFDAQADPGHPQKDRAVTTRA
jgi:hypothetical protein